ncbi:olfactory receptor 52D1-like [Misgurnus anguillicaudatus]|uniref:olfactory receptor 52D1-like n=1 Tax=Misgurnus anguillicaudatus TaxID=75329 RepID=UPI002435A0BB|nr:olfactory receptor 52D1-like [Misgurnus anguillicaudatus]
MDNRTYLIYTLMEPKDSKSFRHIYFTCFLVLYAMLLLLNIWLSVVIVLERALHEPMYIFLCNLCLNDLLGTAGFYPKFLHDLILDSYVIPSYMCAFQAFVIYSSGMCQFCILAVMAYDRHEAICRPLEYHSKLNKVSCSILISLSWIVPFIIMFFAVFLSNRLTVCKYHIDKLFCDNWSMVKLSCESTVTNDIYGFVFISLYMGLVIVIVVSYIKLAIACKASLECRRKFWQTCVPHIISLANFTVATIFDATYNRYGSNDVQMSLRNFLALERLIVPPILNPIIYGLKLKEVRKGVLKSCIYSIKS